ncbi:allergen Tha p 1-like [Epargyreus clarus]|uniref:allergen Tha p 1-like n=1 Tax=Epargyreus clarus TaxID=520877 RepID=UPI003C2AD31B
MKTVLVLCVLVAAAAAFPGETYNPKYDNFNGQEIAENERLLTSYGNCFAHKGPCTQEGQNIRKIIPEALRTSCAKCTPKQRELVRIVVHAFQKKQPQIWNDIVKKEDPNGEFIESFDKFLAATD